MKKPHTKKLAEECTENPHNFSRHRFIKQHKKKKKKH